MIFLVLRNTLHSLLILPYLLQLLPLLRAQIVVSDASVDHLRVAFLQSVRTEIAVGDGFIIGVFKVRLILQFQQLEGVLVYLGSRGGGETDEQGVEILEDGAVFAEHAAMRLVDDDEVEMTDGELHWLGVDVVDHRLIGGEYEAGRLVGFCIVRETGHGLAR